MPVSFARSRADRLRQPGNFPWTRFREQGEQHKPRQRVNFPTKTMNAIDRYQQTQNACRNFERWKSLIGKEYFGGTCGKGGKYGSVVNATFACEIYHQETDGAANYHESERLGDMARQALNEAAKKHASAIIATAFDLMLEKLGKDAAAAQALADAIFADSNK